MRPTVAPQLLLLLLRGAAWPQHEQRCGGVSGCWDGDYHHLGILAP
jgi:hypothetical protein